MVPVKVALELHSTQKSHKSQCFVLARHIGNYGDCVRIRTAGVRVIRLENRQTFTGFVSSNLTLSAKI
jgi:hypothetical protein